MDLDGWIFTIALLLCAIALVVYEPKEKKTCEIYHVAKGICSSFDE